MKRLAGILSATSAELNPKTIGKLFVIGRFKTIKKEIKCFDVEM